MRRRLRKWSEAGFMIGLKKRAAAEGSETDRTGGRRLFTVC